MPSPSPAASERLVESPQEAGAVARASRAPWLLVLTGLLGGAGGWWLLQTYESPFPAVGELEALAGKRRATVPLTPEEDARLNHLQALHETKNSAAMLGLVGMAMGALAGAGAGLVARSGAGVAIGLVVGAVAGGLVAWGGGWAGGLVYYQLKIGLGVPAGYAAMAAHAIIWLFLALAVGAVTWLATRRQGVSFGSVVGAAAGGAIVAAVLYPVLAAIAFPMSNTDLLIPSGRWNRLAWIELAAFAITAAIVFGALRPKAAVPPARPAAPV